MAADLNRLTDDVLGALGRGEAATPPALAFLLRRYCETDSGTVRGALEPALAAALQLPFASLPPGERAAWLRVFVDAAAVSSDERVLAAIDGLLAQLRGEWAETTRLDTATAILDACLAAADVRDPRATVPDAIEALERVIGAAYRPGHGLAHDTRTPDGARGRLADHVQAAAALLTAYGATARIQYPMLAEELMQFVRRTFWDEKAGAFAGAAGGCEHPPAPNCAAVSVWCRLVRLHAADDYRRAAVVAPDTDYRSDAARILAAPSVELAAHGMASALYGLALTEYLAL